jgi:hypothetical protein
MQATPSLCLSVLMPAAASKKLLSQPTNSIASIVSLAYPSSLTFEGQNMREHPRFQERNLRTLRTQTLDRRGYASKHELRLRDSHQTNLS